MLSLLSGWQVPILLSALCLGFYDIFKKHAVRDNAVMPVLFFATLTGSITFVAIVALTHAPSEYAICTKNVWWLLFFKSVIVSSSWSCVYYAMREFPISLVAPVRASSPLWTFIGSLILFNEIPSWIQAAGMAMIFAGYYFFSILGKLEGITWRHRGIHFLILGTLLGASSALYDKYLLGVAQIPKLLVQFWFSIDTVAILGVAYLIRLMFRPDSYKFCWRWSIPATGLFLIMADYLYFQAVSTPDAHISILSLMRRCSCIVTFVFGCWYFRDANVKKKAAALVLILIGVVILATQK